MPMCRWRRVGCLAVAVIVALPVAGCARTADTGPSGAGPSATPSAATPSSPVPTPTSVTPSPAVPSSSPADEPSGRAVAAPVTVVRSGGFAGVTQKIVVESDGRWRFTTSRGRDAGTAKTGRLGAAQVKRLHLLLGDPSFGSAFYPTSCADGYHYSLLTGQRRVEWDDCGGTNPARVARAIVALLVETTPL